MVNATRIAVNSMGNRNLCCSTKVQSERIVCGPFSIRSNMFSKTAISAVTHDKSPKNLLVVQGESLDCLRIHEALAFRAQGNHAIIHSLVFFPQQYFV